MSTPPLLELPVSACAASAVLTLNRVVGITVSPFTLEEQTFKWPGEQWSIDFRMPPFVSRRIASEWIAFSLKLKGSYGMFLLGDPSARNPQGVATGTPQVDGAGQTENTLITKGWANNVAGILLRGDYIQLGTGAASSLHMVVDDANSDSSGRATLSIEPAIKRSPADSSALVVNNARGVFKLAQNSYSWSVDPGPIYRLSFQAVEVVNA